jgi:hypothetical protein
VRLLVNDSRGRADTVLTTATVSNVAPVFAPAMGATIFPGDTWTGSGSFTDPGNDTFTATVNYGDGSGTSALPLTGKSFSLSHRYATSGSYTVTVSVSDGAATSTQTRTINVLTIDKAIPIMIAQIEELAAANRLPDGFAQSFTNKLEMVLAQVDRRPEQIVPLMAQMTAAGRQLDALVRAGLVSATTEGIVRTMIARMTYMIPRAE